MQRRLLIALGTAALSSALLPTRAPAAGLAPIGIAEFGQGRERRVIRVYQDETRGAFLIHVRTGRSTYTQRIRLSGDPEGMMRGLFQDGRARIATDGFDGIVNAAADTQSAFHINGIGQINVVTAPTTTSGPVGSGTIVLIFAVMLAGLGLATGVASATASSSGGKAEAEAEDAEEEEGDGLIASPECDGPPIRLC